MRRRSQNERKKFSTKGNVLDLIHFKKITKTDNFALL